MLLYALDEGRDMSGADLAMHRFSHAWFELRERFTMCRVGNAWFSRERKTVHAHDWMKSLTWTLADI